MSVLENLKSSVLSMALNEGATPGWPQQRRSTSTGQSSYMQASKSKQMDDLGGIMNLISGCGKGQTRKEQWPIHSSTFSNQSYSAPDCCLKNGRIQCSCSFSKNNFSLEHTAGYGKSRLGGDSVLSHDRNLPFWQEPNNTCHFGGVKMAEEYILNDNELRFDFYDMPFDIPKRKHHLRKVGKVKTVSIIDTLSELASGATDREDEGGFSSAVSESSILGRDFYQPRVKHSRHLCNKKGQVFKEHYLSSTPISTDFSLKVNHRPQLKDTLKNCHSSVWESQGPEIQGDNGNFPCSSLKRTLKYLQKAVSTNVVKEESQARRYNCRFDKKKDAFRQCFSDSEVREVPNPWNTIKRQKPGSQTKSKSRSLLTVSPPPHTPILPQAKQSAVKPIIQPRLRAEVPEWIKMIFSTAKNGEMDKLKECLKDVDSSLVRNLSDDHGNNLWHICSSQNHIHCLEWLCSYNEHQSDALKDENKHGFTPIGLAVKHGCLLSVQWLVHNTVSKSQLSGSGNSRSLLHVAAKYGQEATVQWLLSYMNSHDINVNTCDSEGNTPLHLSSKHGHINCVKALIFQNGNLKSQNERGLKPIDLAVKYTQVNCADYLLAMEACYNLAAINLKQHTALELLQKENTDIKEYFKELLTLTKRLQHRQRELLHTFTGIDHPGQFDSTVSDRNDMHSKYMIEYSQLLASVIADEEQRLAIVEDRWKKALKPKLINCKKSPLTVIRSQFTHILNKVTHQSPAVLSTPETSDDSLQSEDEDLSQSAFQVESTKIGSTPDVIHTIPKQQHIPDFGIQQKNSPFNSFPNEDFNFERKHASCDVPEQKVKLSDNKMQATHPVSGACDVNLQAFFKQNPNLRQTGETCSVLEVLEPSSSDSDECLNKANNPKNLNSEDDLLQSSSSSAAETLSPSSCGPCSIRSKKSGSRSSSDGSKHDATSPRSANTLGCISSAKTRMTESVENKGSEIVNNSTDGVSKNQTHALNFDHNSSVEPDLIQGTQKKRVPPLNMCPSIDDKQIRDNCNKETVCTDNPSLSTEDSESFEADRSFCSAIDSPETYADSSGNGNGNKKKSFLLKFSLRSRWPSKQIRQRALKQKLSAEEICETYSRLNCPSQNNASSNSSNQKVSLCEKDSLNLLETPCNLPVVLDNSSIFALRTELPRKNMIMSPMGLLPPRRDPPPIPPRSSKESKQTEIIPDEDCCSGTVNSSSITSSVTESAGSYDPFATNSSSNIWQSPDSKNMFRPASSASRVETSSRGEDNFPLNKSSSASTEVLSALDSSTAGHQSPAPSEVSKTESALSPPSDVSKTESAQHLRQLGRIEESNHLTLTKDLSLQKTSMEEKGITEDTQTIKDSKPHRKSDGFKKHTPDKPWYEISDEEDVITPQRYEVMSGRVQSSSEDEQVVAS